MSILSSVRFRDLSPARRRLIEHLQELNFGTVEQLVVRGGDPVFDPPPRTRREIKFASENGPRPETGLPDFVLKAAHRDLLRLLDDVRDGVVAAITVRHGLPFTAVIAG